MVILSAWVTIFPIWILVVHRNKLSRSIGSNHTGSSPGHINETILPTSMTKLENQTAASIEELYEWNQTLNLALANFTDNSATIALGP